MKSNTIQNPKRCWELHKDHFLRGLLSCAGRRHALGIDSSGCESSRVSAYGRTTRSASFNEWDISSDDQVRGSSISKLGSSSVEEYASALRPMITLFACLDQISKDFMINMEDEKVEESAERLVNVVNQCQKADDIRVLLSIANISMDDDNIIMQIEAGRKTVQQKMI